MTRNVLARVRDRCYRTPVSRWMIRCLPYRLARLLTMGLGLGVYCADRRGRVGTLENLRAALGDRKSEKRLRRLACLTYCHFLVPFLDLLFLIHASPGRIRRFVGRRFDIENMEALEQACREGRGAIVCAPHHGALLLGGAALAFRLGGRIPIHIFADRPDRPQHPSQAYRLLAERLNIHILYNDRLAVRSATRALSAGGILVILPDMFQVSDGLMFVPLFGMLSAMMGGAAYLALATGAPVLLLSALPEGLRFRVVIEPPLRPRSTGEFAKDLYALSLHISQAMEHAIRRRPELWGYWINLHRRAIGRRRVPGSLTWDGCRALVREVRDGLPASSGDTRALANLVLAAMETPGADAPAGGGFASALDAFIESCKGMIPLGGAPCRAANAAHERR